MIYKTKYFDIEYIIVLIWMDVDVKTIKRYTSHRRPRPKFLIFIKISLHVNKYKYKHQIFN